MKISCEIIKDLLPLYHDGVCSDDSKSIIEEHLMECHSCKVELQTIDETLSICNIEQNLKEAESVKKLSRKWKKGMLKSLLKGVLITIVQIAIIAFILYLFVGIEGV